MSREAALRQGGVGVTVETQDITTALLPTEHLALIEHSCGPLSTALPYTLKVSGTGVACFHCPYNSVGLSFFTILPCPPFSLSLPMIKHHWMQEEPRCASAAHNTICYLNTSRALCQRGTSPSHKTGAWEMVTQSMMLPTATALSFNFLCLAVGKDYKYQIAWMKQRWRRSAYTRWVLAAAWIAVLQISRDAQNLC